MTQYYADATTEDGMETVFECEANSLEEAKTYFEEQWPDASIWDVYSHDTQMARHNDLYRRLEARYDDDTYDLY